MTKSPEANPKNLLSLVRNAYSGKLVIPDFQRSFIWDRSDIEEFLSSLLHGYFVGTFLALESSSRDSIFSYTFIEGVKECNPELRKPTSSRGSVDMLLDGQQRLTSLFYAIYSPNIPLKGTKNSFEFYLDLKKIVSNDIDDAIIGISTKNNKQKSEFEAKYDEGLVAPISLVGSQSDFIPWLYAGKGNVWRKEEQQLIMSVHENLSQFMIPVITLPEDTPRSDIVNTFERINRTGVSLSIFDLATAQLYSQEINLRDLWKSFEKNNKNVSNFLDQVSILRVIALINDHEIRRKNLLDAVNLKKEDFENSWQNAVKYICDAYERAKNSYGAFEDKWISSKQQIVALATLLYKASEQSPYLLENIYNKIDTWYWYCTLSQRYDRHYITRVYSDTKRVAKWISGGDIPEWMLQTDFQDMNFKSVQRSSGNTSSLYRGCISILVQQGVRDFLTGQSSVSSKKYEDDHIFCKSIYKNHPFVDSVLNRSLITKGTNQRKGKKCPSDFFKDCLTGHDNNEERLLSTLQTHLISKDAYDALKADDIDRFIDARQRSLGEAAKKLTTVDR
ncbi:DUF262 domain-containing protein [Spirulina major CS-329]|uniref:DUF262 domain-containing protein n=1 Tax=Spirulina TaxID=1154 RepID=UPI00232B87D1|nr:MULTISPECIES: DUF262 domain-containing protein [Spirulina]MDB9496385.1 DUF262 domain-containing protein [Spirulina subsalsa CS-330]MDB9504704.1 DUF262 domain-containing protein [Spirulina major CS-329]